MKAVIFDMDGVLIDSEPVYQAIEQQMFVELGIDVDEKTKASMVGFQMKSTWTKLKQEFSLNQSVEDLILDERGRFKRRMEKGDLSPMTGALVLLKAVYHAGYKTAIASSSYRDELLTATESFGFNPYLDEIVSGEDVKKNKPYPDIFLRAADLIGADPKNCVVIEDSKNGVKAAKQAKMHCIGFCDKDALNQDLSRADATVTKLSDISIEMLSEMLK